MASSLFEEESDRDSFQSESEEEEDAEIKSKPFNNNTKAIEEKLKDILCEHDWIEKLDIVCDTEGLNMPAGEDDDVTKVRSEGLQGKGNVHDDFKREMFFYCQAQVAAKQSMEKLRHLNVLTERPEDYFAEMVKTDAHMHKIREKLAAEKQGRENAEKVKKIRRMKQFGKKVQQEVLQKRQEEKKKMMQAVNRIKKGKDKMKDHDGDLFNINTEKMSQKPQFEKSSKRKKKDQKYGFGGQKKKMKMNTSNSSGDMTGFKSAIHSKAPKASGKGKSKPGKGKPKRLGKTRRHNIKSKKR